MMLFLFYFSSKITYKFPKEIFNDVRFMQKKSCLIKSSFQEYKFLFIA
jgi:hypothetical protein